MKSFLRAILTIWITILLMALGVVFSLKGIIIDTADSLIKKKITNNVIDVIEKSNNEAIPEDVKKKVEDTIENNKEVKKIVNTYFDKMIDILGDKESEIKIDVAAELNELIDDGEKILNDNGITLSEKDKQELLSVVSSVEVNDAVNKSIVEIKENMDGDVKLVLDAYNFLTGPTLKVIIIALIGVALVLIALLSKSLYRWLSNFASAAIISGLGVGVLLPFIVDTLSNNFAKENEVFISVDSLSKYGYILIALGIIAFILKIVISAILKRDKKPKVEKEDVSNVRGPEEKEEEVKEINGDSDTNEDSQE